MRRRFADRVLLPEWMDTERVPPEDLAACLRDLGTVNRLTRAFAPTLGFVRRACARHGRADPLRILDVGGGDGDTLRRLDRWARRRGIALALTSLDRHPDARVAGERAGRREDGAASPIRFVTGDILDWPGPEPVDLVISSLVAHHLDDAEVVGFLRVMERTARLGWFVNDLHRHPVPFHVFRVWSRLAGWHRFVRHDGPVSIGRAFRRPDWRRLLTEAGVPPGAASVDWRVPFRVCVTRWR